MAKRLFSFEQDEINAILNLFPHGVIALDIETTGLSSLCDEILELGAVKISSNGQSKTFSQLVKNTRPIPEVSKDFHGIDESMLINSPPITEALKDFLRFCGDLPLVAHNAQFDAGFIIFQLHQNQLTPQNNSIFCTVQYTRKCFKGLNSYGLAALAKKFSIPLENHHRALDDAYAALKIFSQCAARDLNGKHLDAAQVYSLKEFDLSKIQSHHPIIKKVSEIIRKQQECKMIYEGGSYRGKWRPVTPMAVMPTPKGDILYALCSLSQMHKSFLIKKITQLRSCDKQEYEQLIMKFLSK